MARYSSVTDPAAEVNVTATITQKQREDLRMLSLTKEHLSLKAIIAKLIQDYLDENAAQLSTLAEWRQASAVPAEDVLATH